MLINFGTLVIEDVFEIEDRGVVVSGKISEGTFKIGDDIIIINPKGEQIPSKVKDIEVFGHIEYAQKGDYIGILLDSLTVKNINIGDVVKRCYLNS